MSQQQPILIKNFINATDIYNKQYFFVHMSDDNTVNLADGSKKPIGVLNIPNKQGITNVPVGVSVLGSSKIVIKKNADNAYPSAGDLIVSASDGYGMKRKTEDFSLVRGIALESASADGDIIEIFLI